MERENMAGKIIPPHGGYRDLKSYQMAEIIYDGTVVFCRRFIDRRSRTIDQMVQAARSGKQNIVEGSMASGTSKKTELKLMGVARASLEELLQDAEDFLRQKKLPEWDKNHAQSREIRALCYQPNRSYLTYKPYFERGAPEVAANALICLIHQANFLLDQRVTRAGTGFSGKGRLHRAALSGQNAEKAESA